MKKVLTIIILITCICSFSFSQNNVCNVADPFCTGATYNFPAPINAANAETGPNYGCLLSQPNPIWFYLSIDQPGDFTIDIHSSTGVEIDYICWGPLNTFSDACNNLNVANIVDCDYTTSGQKWCNITNTQIGKYYILLITNYSNQPTNIIFSQSNIGQTNFGATNCGGPSCEIDTVSYTVDPCNLQTNQYSISGNIFFHSYNPYWTIDSILTIVDQPSGNSQILYGQFPNSISPKTFNINNIYSDGLQHTLTASFINESNCTYIATYTSPDSCSLSNVLENTTKCLLTIFPNPVVNNIFSINYSSKSFDNISIKIINTQGIEVFSKSISKNSESFEIQIDSSGLINGYYLVEINDGQKIIRKSLVVQNIY